MKVIVDTGPWSEFFRRPRSQQSSQQTAIASEVRRLIRADAVQMLGPIRQELLSGARPDTRFAQLRDGLRFFPNLATDEQDDELAAEFNNQCRNKGIQGTSTDLLICAVATRHKMKILSLDSDFEHYSTILPIKLHRPGGTLH